MSQFLIKTPHPLFRRSLRKAPGQPMGDRVVVREHAPESVTEGGIKLAENAQRRVMAGTLLAAGDQAADRLYDLGAEIGDEVWFAQYAGLIEEWQHLVSDDVAECQHAGTWDRVGRDDQAWAKVGLDPDDSNVTALRRCSSCGTLKASERCLAMSVDDLVVNVDIQERLESGAMQRRRGIGPNGETRYFIARQGVTADTFETDPNAQAKRAALAAAAHGAGTSSSEINFRYSTAPQGGR